MGLQLMSVKETEFLLPRVKYKLNDISCDIEKMIYLFDEAKLL